MRRTGQSSAARKSVAGGRDGRAIALEHAPVHAGVLVVDEIARRHAAEFGAADIGADRDDQIVPAAARLERLARRRVAALGEHRFETVIEPVHRVAEFLLLVEREAHRQRRLGPGRPRLVDGAALLFGDRHPRIAVGRMQPAAAEVERETRCIGNRPGPPAQPRRALRSAGNRCPHARSRRPAAMPAAPPPMIATSVSLSSWKNFIHGVGKAGANEGKDACCNAVDGARAGVPAQLAVDASFLS